jgi:hypothetical protein
MVPPGKNLPTTNLGKAAKAEDMLLRLPAMMLPTIMELPIPVALMLVWLLL